MVSATKYRNYNLIMHMYVANNTIIGSAALRLTEAIWAKTDVEGSIQIRQPHNENSRKWSYERSCLQRSIELESIELQTLTTEKDSGQRDEAWFCEPIDRTYRVFGTNKNFTVLITLSETLIRYTGVVVHPHDKRNMHLVAESIRHLLVVSKLPIIKYYILADISFGRSF